MNPQSGNHHPHGELLTTGQENGSDIASLNAAYLNQAPSQGVLNSVDRVVLFGGLIGQAYPVPGSNSLPERSGRDHDPIPVEHTGALNIGGTPLDNDPHEFALGLLGADNHVGQGCTGQAPNNAADVQLQPVLGAVYQGVRDEGCPLPTHTQAVEHQVEHAANQDAQWELNEFYHGHRPGPIPGEPGRPHGPQLVPTIVR
ncbi:hypothetical protein D5S17_13100 [Pseudonocardiaceae bacterium YIM PH 21723]|nr:hypothetical protein D5S17_13100 [Pseudonocardiaceae bacterium YIM PH 21723]